MKKILIYLLLISSLANAQTSGIGYDIKNWVIAMNSDGRNDTLSVQNIDLQFTDAAIPNRIDSAAFYLIGTDLSSTEIDNMLIRIAANGSINGKFVATGSNGFPTSASAAARSTSTTNGWSLELNGELLTNISYDNLDQVIDQNDPMVSMTPTPTPIGAASYIYYQLWGAPTGVTINGYTGVISATSITGAIDEYAMMVRATAWGGYTSMVEVPLTITVVSAAPVLENYVYIDFGFTTPTVNAYGDYFAKVAHTKYTAGATELNLIDHTNTATTIDFTNVVAWTGEASSTGSRYNGVLDFLPAEVTIDAFYLTSASTMEIQLDVSGETDWALKTYVVKGGGFRAFLGSEAAGMAEVSTDGFSTLDTYSCAWDAIGGGADPNSAAQTYELPAVPNGSGIISIEYRKAAGATEVECGWLLLETYN